MTAKERRLRQDARRTRDYHWSILEQIDRLGTLWFTPWNKNRREEGPDELRMSLIGGMEFLRWMDRHPDWIRRGRWSAKRDARPLRLTDAGRDALRHRERYDMEPVEGGLVHPGWSAVPAPRATLNPKP